MTDYERDILKAIEAAEKEGADKITIKVHFPPNAAKAKIDKTLDTTSEIEKKLKSTLDELSNHAQEVEEVEPNPEDDCFITRSEGDEMESEEHDSWPDTYEEMLTDIYEHFDDELADVQAELSEIHKNIDMMMGAIPQSFDILEERLGVAPASKTKKKDIKHLENHLVDIRHRLEDLRDFALENQNCNTDYQRSTKHLIDILTGNNAAIIDIRHRLDDLKNFALDARIKEQNGSEAILEHLNDLNDVIGDIKTMAADDLHKKMDEEVADIYKMLLISKGNEGEATSKLDEVLKRLDNVVAASAKATQEVLKGIYARQDAMEDKLDKIITLLQPKTPAKKPAAKKPTPSKTESKQ